MAELARQSSRERFMLGFLMNQVGLSASVAHGYVPGLVDEGYDTEEIFLGLSPEELRDDFEWKKGHIKKFEMFLAQKLSLPRALSAEGAPVGTQLPDGSTLMITDTIIGRGGSGVVRKAILTRRSGATEEVAAKMLAAGASERESQKFAKEYDLSLAAAQQCSGTCRIYGCVRFDGALCLVMKLYVGDLAQKLDGRRDAAGVRVALQLGEAHAYLLDIAQSLVELHTMGISVQDLKPSNLLEDDSGRLVVADFGIAVLAEATFTNTASRTGSGGGTVYYMSPEQHDPDEFGKTTVQTDIWAWACIAVEMLSGATPWNGKRALEILGRVVNKRETPQMPPGVPDWLSKLMQQSFSYAAAERPTAKQLVEQLIFNLDQQADDAQQDPDRCMSVVPCGPGTVVYMHADALLQNTWIKREQYEFLRLIEVQEIDHPRLQHRYEEYKRQLTSGGAVETANEQLVFHGCAEDAIAGIVAHGFLKSFWKSAAGDWQRFGPGFYFALQASKSHEYPLGPMDALEVGEHSRTMLLCKVAKGSVYQTRENLDALAGRAPAGYHSVHGIATADGPLNYDELVVFEEEAMLPYAVVTYRFVKKQVDVLYSSPEMPPLQSDDRNVALCGGVDASQSQQELTALLGGGSAPGSPGAGTVAEPEHEPGGGEAAAKQVAAETSADLDPQPDPEVSTPHNGRTAMAYAEKGLPEAGTGAQLRAETHRSSSYWAEHWNTDLLAQPLLALPYDISEHEHSRAIVLEIGNFCTKCGFAAQQGGTPSAVPQLMIATHFDLTATEKPIESWIAELRPHLDDVFFKHFACSPAGRDIVVVEELLAPAQLRQALAQCLFDLRVASVTFAPSSLLAILTSGTRTGIVCDIGAAGVRVLPVYEGLPLLSAYTTSHVGYWPSVAIRKTLAAKSKLARAHSVSVDDDTVVKCCVVPPGHAAKVDELKQELGSLGDNSARQRQWLKERLALVHRLEKLEPELTECNSPGFASISAEARRAPAAVLFGDGGETIASLIVHAVLASPEDVRLDILKNIVLAGGNAMFPGIVGRMINVLDHEMAAVPALATMRPAVRIARPAFQPNTLSWVGGALIACSTEKVIDTFRRTERGLPNDDSRVHLHGLLRSAIQASPSSMYKQEFHSRYLFDTSSLPTCIGLARVRQHTSGTPKMWHWNSVVGLLPTNFDSSSSAASEADPPEAFQSELGPWARLLNHLTTALLNLTPDDVVKTLDAHHRATQTDSASESSVESVDLMPDIMRTIAESKAGTGIPTAIECVTEILKVSAIDLVDHLLSMICTWTHLLLKVQTEMRPVPERHASDCSMLDEIQFWMDEAARTQTGSIWFSLIERHLLPALLQIRWAVEEDLHMPLSRDAEIETAAEICFEKCINPDPNTAPMDVALAARLLVVLAGVCSEVWSYNPVFEELKRLETLARSIELAEERQKIPETYSRLFDSIKPMVENLTTASIEEFEACIIDLFASRTGPNLGLREIVTRIFLPQEIWTRLDEILIALTRDFMGQLARVIRMDDPLGMDHLQLKGYLATVKTVLNVWDQQYAIFYTYLEEVWERDDIIPSAGVGVSRARVFATTQALRERAEFIEDILHRCDRHGDRVRAESCHACADSLQASLRAAETIKQQLLRIQQVWLSGIGGGVKLDDSQDSLWWNEVDAIRLQAAQIADDLVAELAVLCTASVALVPDAICAFLRTPEVRMHVRPYQAILLARCVLPECAGDFLELLESIPKRSGRPAIVQAFVAAVASIKDSFDSRPRMLSPDAMETAFTEIEDVSALHEMAVVQLQTLTAETNGVVFFMQDLQNLARLACDSEVETPAAVWTELGSHHERLGFTYMKRLKHVLMALAQQEHKNASHQASVRAIDHWVDLSCVAFDTLLNSCSRTMSGVEQDGVAAVAVKSALGESRDRVLLMSSRFRQRLLAFDELCDQHEQLLNAVGSGWIATETEAVTIALQSYLAQLGSLDWLHGVCDCDPFCLSIDVADDYDAVWTDATSVYYSACANLIYEAANAASIRADAYSEFLATIPFLVDPTVDVAQARLKQTLTVELDYDCTQPKPQLTEHFEQVKTAESIASVRPFQRLLLCVLHQRSVHDDSPLVFADLQLDFDLLAVVRQHLDASVTCPYSCAGNVEMLAHRLSFRWHDPQPPDFIPLAMPLPSTRVAALLWAYRLQLKLSNALELIAALTPDSRDDFLVEKRRFDLEVSKLQRTWVFHTQPTYGHRESAKKCVFRPCEDNGTWTIKVDFDLGAAQLIREYHELLLLGKIDSTSPGIVSKQIEIEWFEERWMSCCTLTDSLRSYELNISRAALPMSQPVSDAHNTVCEAITVGAIRKKWIVPGTVEEFAQQFSAAVEDFKVAVMDENAKACGSGAGGNAPGSNQHEYQIFLCDTYKSIASEIEAIRNRKTGSAAKRGTRAKGGTKPKMESSTMFAAMAAKKDTKPKMDSSTMFAAMAAKKDTKSKMDSAEASAFFAAIAAKKDTK